MELIEITVAGETYKIRKLSAYQAMKLLGNGAGKDLADIQRDLILTAVIEPKLKREDIQEFDEEKFFGLSSEIEKINEKVIAALGNSMKRS